MMQLAVSGATGYVGSAVMKELTALCLPLHGHVMTPRPPLCWMCSNLRGV